MINKVRVILFSFMLFLPVVALGAPSDIIQPGDNPGNILPTSIFNQPATVGGTIFGILKLSLGIVGLIAVAMIIYGGFRYITAGGSEDITKSAKQTILNSLIGLVIIILSYVIVTVITNLAFGRVT